MRAKWCIGFAVTLALTGHAGIAAPQSGPVVTAVPDVHEAKPSQRVLLDSAQMLDRVHMGIYSWGKLISEWTIYSDGSAQIRLPHNGSGNLQEHVVVTKSLGAIKGRYEQIANILRSAEIYAGKVLPCPNRITDLPYGEISWKNERVHGGFNFDYGCSSAKMFKVFDQREAAQALMKEWTANAPDVDDPPTARLNPSR